MMAIGMAGVVAFVSVGGLLKIFTGAGTAGLILFSALEVGKIIATSAIHTYGKRIGWFYNSLLSLMILIAMGITSMGIYGFLSSSYKESFAKMESVNSQVELLETKKDGYQEQLNFVVEEKNTLNKTIGELSKGLSNNVIQYKDPETGEIITTTSSSTRRALEKQLDNAVVRQEKVNVKADTLSSIIFRLDTEILETKLANDSANELSTLQYLSDITGKSMDEVMKWFIFLLIIIGDPMAILMVIVFSKVVNGKGDDSVGNTENDTQNDTPNPSPEKRIFNIEVDNSAKDVDGYVKELANKFKKPIFDSETGVIALNQPVEEVVEDDALVDGYDKMIQDKLKRDIPIEIEEVRDAVEEVIEEPVIKEPVIEESVVEVSGPQRGIIEEENTPEEQIEENIDEVKQLKREPVIPRGKIIEADVIDVKDDRGFSVDIPQSRETRRATDKEIKEGVSTTIYFDRPNDGSNLSNQG